ncbi:symmetrical bis(5'-nucleosyl)-tetraphosphatase [Vreelandella sp. GE22]
MALYVVGDVHGCIDDLEEALGRIGFDPNVDRLWSVGDLVGKGPHSLEVLRLVASLGDRFQMVLGNHETRLLGQLAGAHGSGDGALAPVLSDKGSVDWKHWLRQQPLLLREPSLELTLSHAGIFPGWSLALAERYAFQASQVLRMANDAWLAQLALSPYRHTQGGMDSWQHIICAFTEMRYCDVSDPNHPTIDFTAKSPAQKSASLVPWFDAWPIQSGIWAFGHWSSLRGETGRADIRCLDTGCVYGRTLSVVRVVQGALIDV